MTYIEKKDIKGCTYFYLSENKRLASNRWHKTRKYVGKNCSGLSIAKDVPPNFSFVPPNFSFVPPNSKLCPLTSLDKQKLVPFMNLPDDYRTAKSKFSIIPISFELNVVKGEGSCLGSAAIIDASKEIDYFDCDLGIESYEKGITTELPLIIKEKDFAKVTQSILDKTKSVIDVNRFPIVLGSDHSTTVGVVSALEAKYNGKDDFAVIVFDAHSDLYEPWGKETWYHACVSRMVSEKHKTLVVGVRAQDFYENEFLNSKENKNAKVIFMKDLLSKENTFCDFSKSVIFNNQLKSLPKKVYLSIDVDAFDPSVIKNTNTPEPGGLTYNQLLSMIEKIFKEKEVIGIDVVEFAPKGNKDDYFSEAYTLAKLVYRMIGYKQVFS